VKNDTIFNDMRKAALRQHVGHVMHVTYRGEKSRATISISGVLSYMTPEGVALNTGRDELLIDYVDLVAATQTT